LGCDRARGIVVRLHPQHCRSPLIRFARPSVSPGAVGSRRARSASRYPARCSSRAGARSGVHHLPVTRGGWPDRTLERV